MAILDEKRDVCVVRIVYDGPPFSGKTTTLRALSENIARPLESPEEHNGRTLYFDWLDYTAGRFEGRPVRCQIVSVPGQRSLAARRQALLREADSVVFIADTGSIGMNLSLKYARELGGILSSVAEPRPGVVIGANKRDVDDALPVKDVIEQFRNVGLDGAVIETTATLGAGIRDAFLFGVRLALDRAREQSRRGQLVTGSPLINSCDDLLKQFTVAGENKDQSSPVSSGSLPAVERKPETTGQSCSAQIDPDIGRSKPWNVEPASRELQPITELLPDPSVASGLIWPPIEGRVVIQQALVSGEPEIQTTAAGVIHVSVGDSWTLHSREQDIFTDQHSARMALVEWARLHVRNIGLLSPRRCIVVSPYKEQWRLWQIVKADRSIDSFLSTGICRASTRKSVEYLLVAGRKLLEAAKLFVEATVTLPTDLEAINVDSAEPRYIGLMPGFDAEKSGKAAINLDEERIVSNELAKYAHALSAHSTFSDIFFELDSIRSSSPSNSQLADTLQKLFIEEKVRES